MSLAQLSTSLLNVITYMPIFVIDLTFRGRPFYGCHWLDTQDPIIVYYDLSLQLLLRFVAIPWRICSICGSYLGSISTLVYTGYFRIVTCYLYPLTLSREGDINLMTDFSVLTVVELLSDCWVVKFSTFLRLNVSGLL